MATTVTLADAVQGARHTPITVIWGINLTGATLTGTKRRAGYSAATVIDGTLVASSPATAGIFVWTLGAGDVGEAGEFRVQFKAQFTNYDMTIESEWLVNENQGVGGFPAGALVGVTAEQAAFLDLLDVDSPTDGQVLTYDSVTSEWVNETPAAGVTTFLGLSDTPNSYVDQSNKLLRVNAATNAVEFFDSPYALDNDLESHTANTANPHAVTAAQVGALTPAAAALLYQPLDGELTALAGLASAADTAPYFTGSGTAALTPFTTTGRSLVSGDAANARTVLGLVIGTNVQAQDAELAAIAGLTSAADKGIQFTGAGTAGTFDLTTAGKALLDDVDAAAQRATLGAAAASSLASYLPLAGGTLTGPLLLPAGLVGAPSLARDSDSTTGLYFIAAGPAIAIAGVLRHRFTAEGHYIEKDDAVIAMGASGDLTFGREAAAILQLGIDAASPVAQTVKAHDGLNSNSIGANLIIAGGRGTGSAAGGSVIIQTAPAGSSGSSQNALVDRLTVSPTGAVTIGGILTAGNSSVIGTVTFAAGNVIAGSTDVKLRTGSVSEELFLQQVTNTRLVIRRTTGNVGIGSSVAAAVPVTRLHVWEDDAVTAAITNVITLGHNTSGTPAAGYGVGLVFQLESGTTVDQSAARIAAVWNDPVLATKKADLVFYASDSAAEREGLRIRADGTKVLLITGLPTSSPGVTGALWNDSGTVKVSA